MRTKSNTHIAIGVALVMVVVVLVALRSNTSVITQPENPVLTDNYIHATFGQDCFIPRTCGALAEVVCPSADKTMYHYLEQDGGNVLRSYEITDESQVDTRPLPKEWDCPFE